MNNNKRASLAPSRRRVLYFVMFPLSVLAAFALSGDKNVFSLLVKSLFLFVPAYLIYGTVLAIREDVVEYRRTRKLGQLLVILIFIAAIAYCLLLMVLASKALLMRK
jgi:hypothetical protein